MGSLVVIKCPVLSYHLPACLGFRHGMSIVVVKPRSACLRLSSECVQGQAIPNQVHTESCLTAENSGATDAGGISPGSAAGLFVTAGSVCVKCVCERKRGRASEGAEYRHSPSNTWESQWHIQCARFSCLFFPPTWCTNKLQLDNTYFHLNTSPSQPLLCRENLLLRQVFGELFSCRTIQHRLSVTSPVPLLERSKAQHESINFSLAYASSRK